MNSFSHFPLQQALYEALSNDAGLSALITGVYDHVPQNTAQPYVTIGEISGRDWSSKTTEGMEFTASVHAVVRERGRKAVTEIMEHIYDILHDGSLTITGNNCILIRFQSSDIRMEVDGLTYHGIMRFQVLVHTN